MPHRLETVGHDLDEVLAKSKATRAALHAALEAEEAPNGELVAVVARRERMASELERMEGVVAGQAIAASESV